MGRVGSIDRLGGLLLRYELCLVLKDARRSLTIAELVHRVAADGFDVGANPHKVIADAVRWEVRRGRIARVRRGVYATSHLPRSSESKMRSSIGRLRAEKAAGPNSLERGASEEWQDP